MMGFGSGEKGGNHVDETFAALSHAHRREVLTSLLDREPVYPLETNDGENLDERITMYHHPLPKLAQLGFIDWDRNDNRVTRGPKFERIEELFRGERSVVGEHEDP